MSSDRLTRREQVADRLHSAAIHLLRQLRASDAELGLSASRLSALSVLVFAGDKTLGELADAEQVRPPTMTKLVQALEADGLVRRTSIPHDKRTTRVRATAKGRRILHAGRRMRVHTLSELLRTLSADELSVLLQAADLMECVADRGGRG
jgi:DNA-binding MarR family transcriptional regulator